MDTKMQGPGCVTKAEKDNEQILWLAGIAAQFLAVHSLVVPSYAANHPQASLQSFVLSCSRPSQATEIITTRQFQVSSAPNLQ